MCGGMFAVFYNKATGLPSKPIVLATVPTKHGTAKLFLSQFFDSASGRNLVFRLPALDGKGRETILAEECIECEKGAIVPRENDFVIAAIPSRVPQVYVVKRSGLSKQLNSAFGHEDWFWVTKDLQIVFAQLDYKSGPRFKKLEQYQLLNPNTLNFQVVSIKDAQRRKIDFAKRSSGK